MTPHLLYLILIRAFGEFALLGRAQASKDTDNMVLRLDVALLPRQVNRPKPDSADWAVLSALASLPASQRSVGSSRRNTVGVARHRGLVGRSWIHPNQPGRSRIGVLEKRVSVTAPCA